MKNMLKKPWKVNLAYDWNQNLNTFDINKNNINKYVRQFIKNRENLENIVNKR